ncbi:hypothetical protein MYP_688 [Sporocytophaga myxococcoides]|uniref:Uncharacterized protein n=1 Tax=Sporocytophaga myxococcoides TaxID=153721 RepID=A0A098L988_9BACT|nr:hypothetical protein [Sporocytophaga myxococcoides]GAL83461.1 hypothetical protein MYP_688 [Sporocytophaga myxococcoides]
MRRILITESHQLAELNFHKYNMNKPRKERLKDGDLRLIQKMISVYALEISRINSMLPPDYTPNFSTNNAQMASMVGICKDTVRNRRKRLEKAGFITSTKNHGWFHNYDLSFSPEIIFTGEKKDAETLKAELKKIRHEFNLKEKESRNFHTMQENFSPSETQEINNILNSNVEKSATSVKNEAELRPETHTGKAKKTGKHMPVYKNHDKEDLGNISEAGPGGAGGAGQTEDTCRGAKPPISLTESEGYAFAPPERQREKEIEYYVDNLLKMAISFLWKDKTFAESQKDQAKNMLRTYYYDKQHTYNLPDFHNYCVSKLLNHATVIKNSKGKYYAVLPHLYFDPDYAYGFSGSVEKLFKKFTDFKKFGGEPDKLLKRHVRAFENNLRKPQTKRRDPIELQRIGLRAMLNLKDQRYADRYQSIILGLTKKYILCRNGN